MNGLPKMLTLKEMLELLRRAPARRSSPAGRSSTCAKAEERAHILAGPEDRAREHRRGRSRSSRQSKDVETARDRPDGDASACPRSQAQAILDMRLQRLTSLEIKKIIDELAEILALIEQPEGPARERGRRSSAS